MTEQRSSRLPGNMRHPTPPVVLGSAFAAVIILLLAVGVVGASGLQTTRANLTSIRGNAVPSLIHLLSARQSMYSTVRSSRDAALAIRSEERAYFERLAHGNERAVLREFRRYMSYPYTGTAERRRALATYALLQQWVALDRRVAALARDGSAADRHDARRLSVGAEALLVRRIERNLGRLISINMRLFNLSARSAVDAYDRVLLLFLGMVVSAVLLTCALAAGAVLYLRGRTRLEALTREQLERASRTDSLTQVGNYQAFLETLPLEIQRSLRTGSPMVLASIDLDDFKAINDREGHIHGDHVLAGIGRLLMRRRATDRAFRVGGDEFILLLPHTTLDRSLVALSRLATEATAEVFGVTLSIGAAVFLPGASDPSLLREQADAALYEAKRRGRNMLVTYEDIAGSAPFTRKDKVEGLGRLLDERRFTVMFRPIQAAGGKEVLGVEGVIQPDPALGLEGPQEAFDLADHLGRLAELDRLSRGAVLRGAGTSPPRGLLFVNLAGPSFIQDDREHERLMQEIRDADLEPGGVVLTFSMRRGVRGDLLIRELQHLRESGFPVALDEIGAETIGVPVLRRVSVSYVVLAPALLLDAAGDPAARSLLRGVLTFMADLNIAVIVKGVDSEDLLQVLDAAAPAGTPARRAIAGLQGRLMEMPAARPSRAPQLE